MIIDGSAYYLMSNDDANSDIGRYQWAGNICPVDFSIGRAESVLSWSAEKLLARMDILKLASGYQGSDHPSADLRPVGLGIFKGDGCNWVKPFLLHSHFSADSSWELWTDHILQVSGTILKGAEIFDTVRAFRQTVVFSDEAFMAMLESFLPQTNTFVVTNSEIGFSLKELSAITGLPILGNLYEERRRARKSGVAVREVVAFCLPTSLTAEESSESTTQEARAKNPDSKKISTMRENLKVFFASTDAIHSDHALRRDLAV
ncbi:hypothetical protein MRB53_016692 [Persea americana]|uniref:Uncharacterized protein n=1 Tax=Persea americana TaxID=3435 RepID=A0ACC2M2W3_PERAE|nr:hypothetical protein MRB53_016692 [Persea americana]